MSRSPITTALFAAAILPLLATATFADDGAYGAGYAEGGSGTGQAMAYGTVNNGVPVDGGGYGYNYADCYPQINASLYPCPKPDVPYEVGRTLITNPALAPHEMLYPHRYRALYPPYYYKNTHGLSCIPLFPKPKLRGTEVTIKYKSHCGLFNGFIPPIRRVCYNNRSWK